LSEPSPSDLQNTQSPTPSTSQTTEPEPSQTSEPEPSNEPRNVLVLRSDIIDQNLSDVTAQLTEQGFVVNAIPGELIPGDDPRVRTVYAVSPTGSIPEGSTIDVTYYVGDFVDIPVEIPQDPEEPAPTDEPVDPDAPSEEPAPTDSQSPTEPEPTATEGTSG
jgi:hypothetical protein